MPIRNRHRLSILGIARRRRITNSCTLLFIEKMMFEVCKAQTRSMPIHSDRTKIKITTPYKIYFAKHFPVKLKPLKTEHYHKLKSKDTLPDSV